MLEEKIKKEGIDCCIDEIGEMMQGLVRAFHTFERIKISKRGFTNSQCYTLLNIYKYDSLPMKDLSEKMNLDTSTMTRIVNNLVRDGLVKRKHSKEDRRVVLVSLTKKGNSEANLLYKEVVAFYRTIINELPEGKILEVVETMEHLWKAFEKAKPKCC